MVSFIHNNFLFNFMKTVLAIGPPLMFLTWINEPGNDWTLSHLSAQCGKSYIVWKRKTILKFLTGKKTFKKCNPPDFKFYPSKLIDKNFPHMVYC